MKWNYLPKAPYLIYIDETRLSFGKVLSSKQYDNLVFANRFQQMRESHERNYQRTSIVTQVCQKLMDVQ